MQVWKGLGKAKSLDISNYKLLLGIMSETRPETIEEYRRKLKFRAWHRGTREMDLILGSFADANITSFDQDRLNQFEKLLENPDPDLYEWVSGQNSPPEEERSPVMDLLLKHRFAR